MSRNPQKIPVVDLFAGPGGLGEGFAASTDNSGHRRFQVVLSIEMEEAAHRTLELRSFFRAFSGRKIPEEYYQHLQLQLSLEDLFRKYPREAEIAQQVAWKAELGGKDAHPDEVDRKFRKAVGPSSAWVLCGGPPCQAYSVIGRSRNGGIAEDDHRVYLYKEYLRILSEHRPPVFIMENVKGLLSSRVGADGIFKQMLDDLRQPATALGRRKNGHTRYLLYSLVRKPSAWDFNGTPDFKPGDFVIRCEDFGIPQSRHRVIILGMREDLAGDPVPVLQPRGAPVFASQVLKGLPRLRSGLSRTPDGKAEWREALNRIFENGRLDAIPNGKGDDVRLDIRWTLGRLLDMRADRGGEFVACETRTDYESELYCDPRIGGVCNHISRPHMVEDLYRYLFVACYARVAGRSPELRDFPPRLLPEHKNVGDRKKQEYFDDRFRVQVADKPSTTVTCHLSKDGHYFIHYDETQCRSMTVREAARLQTFPDNYVFCGTRTRQYTQVGNAVPPLRARQIAAVVCRILARDTAGAGPVGRTGAV